MPKEACDQCLKILGVHKFFDDILIGTYLIQNSEIRDKSPPSSDVSIDEGLSERLREMDVADLMEQRDVFTRQIVTSLVALHQLNQELDRRRRRKSYSTFRQKDGASQKWAYGNYGSILMTSRN